LVVILRKSGVSSTPQPLGSIHASDLGSFTLSYLGQTNQVTQRQLANTTLSTAWSYLSNSGDRRLAGINNVGLSTAQFSAYNYTTTPENFISALTESSDSASVYPSALTQTANYNNLNQLTNLSGQALTFDSNGNLLSDGQRNYSWDAENRLIGITYSGQPGKQTAFSYDGLSRRTAITSTPAGGSATVTSYIWCGNRICQARNASNSPIRGYYAEGEFVPGTPAQSYYYGQDQIGSVRRVFASASNAPAYGYDPYGSALQTAAPLTDFNYSGMFYNADSGLYLTQYRAYDPLAGRWLSRDLTGEGSDPAANLYAYVRGRLIDLSDLLGLCDNSSDQPDAQNAANDNKTPQGTCDYALAMCRAYGRVQDFTPQEQIDYSAGCGAAYDFCQYKADTGNINNKQGDRVFFPDGGSVKFQQGMPPLYIPRPGR
jgi:RHS repeat-associated protein